MSDLSKEYEVVIGFECHVQLKTNSKLFSVAKNSARAMPNELVDVVDLGMPGVLPSLNKQAVAFAIRLATALECRINKTSIFSRKHYFYPDLPKGYQISQFDKPIAENGMLYIMQEGQKKGIRIRRIHIEEDAGKSIHAEGSKESYVDFNRAGAPLLEVVTEPDISSKEEAAEALKALRQIVMELDICDGNMQEGSLRADVNVSIRKKGSLELNTRTETKNLNSFKFLKNAIAYEFNRQLIETSLGNKIEQETRLWDNVMKESRTMRSKENATDYRYFPDPDLLPLVLEDSFISEISKTLVELPLDKSLRYQAQFGLSEYDANIIVQHKNLASLFENSIAIHNNPKIIANFLINDIIKTLKNDDDDEIVCKISPNQLAKLVELLDQGVISSSSAKKVCAQMLMAENKDPLAIVKEYDLAINTGLDVDDLIKKVIDENPSEVVDFKKGKDKLFGFLMGQLMKKSQGKIDPKKADELLKKALN